jgi:hypothetical protein
MENIELNEQLADLKQTEQNEVIEEVSFEEFLNDLNETEPETENKTENETENETEPETENETEPETEEYPLGYAFATVHENFIPTISKILVEKFTDKTLDLRGCKFSKKQKNELAKAYEVIAKQVTTSQSPVMAAAITIIGITAGQILTNLKDKPKEQSNTGTISNETNENEIIQTKKKRGRPRKNI